MGRFVEVNMGFKRVVTVAYSPAELLAAPIEVAEAAIAQEEASFMTGRFKGQVLEDISSLLWVDALWKKTLANHFQTKHFGDVVCTYVGDGRANWKFSLRCEECNGSGTTYTMSNKRVPCPDCDEGGVTAEAFFDTDLDGRFVGWDEGAAGHPFWSPVVNYGHGCDAIRLVAMPQEQALEAVAGWWS